MIFLISEASIKSIICICICIGLLYIALVITSLLSAFKFRKKIKNCYSPMQIILVNKYTTITKLESFLNENNIVFKKEYDLEKIINNSLYETYLNYMKIYNNLIISLANHKDFLKTNNNLKQITTFSNETDIQFFKLLENYNFYLQAYNYWISLKLTFLFSKLFKLKKINHIL